MKLDLEAIEARANVATNETVLVEVARIGYQAGHEDTVEGVYADPLESAEDIVDEMHSDSKPIAQAREDIHALIARVRELEVEKVCVWARVGDGDRDAE